MKSAHIGSFPGPYFPAFELNTERYSVSLRIQSECGKMQVSSFKVSRILLSITIIFFNLGKTYHMVARQSQDVSMENTTLTRYSSGKNARTL